MYCVLLCTNCQGAQKVSKIRWQGQLYEYTCYSNGLAQCPRCFTKITKPIYVYLHTLGHILTGYLDDSLLLAVEYNGCVKTIADAISTFDKLGFVVHPSKPVSSPTQEITYLGFIINSKEMTVRLTEKRKLALTACCVAISSNRKNKIRDIARLLGLMVASFSAVHMGPLHYRELEKEKIKALQQNKNREAYMTISDRANDELQW